MKPAHLALLLYLAVVSGCDRHDGSAKAYASKSEANPEPPFIGVAPSEKHSKLSPAADYGTLTLTYTGRAGEYLPELPKDPPAPPPPGFLCSASFRLTYTGGFTTLEYILELWENGIRTQQSPLHASISPPVAGSVDIRASIERSGPLEEIRFKLTVPLKSGDVDDEDNVFVVLTNLSFASTKGVLKGNGWRDYAPKGALSVARGEARTVWGLLLPGISVVEIEREGLESVAKRSTVGWLLKVRALP